MEQLVGPKTFDLTLFVKNTGGKPRATEPRMAGVEVFRPHK